MSSILRHFKSNRGLAILLFCFLALAIFYSVIIPLFEGPDEDDHFRYVKYIADHHALPIQQFERGGGEAGHQGWQPPFYYALAALFISPLDTSDFAEHLIRNEYATVVGDPACCGRNLYYHYSNESFPYTRTALAVHLARMLSILFGAVTVAATYALTKSVLDNWHMAIAAAALVAFNPSFLFASALVSNDTMLAAVSSLTLLVWVSLIKGNLTANPRSFAVLGALIALGTLTKTTALALFPFSILLLAVLAWKRRNSRAFILAMFAFLLPFVLLTSWWFIRNQMLYRDWLATRLVTASALFPRVGDLTLAEFFQISLPQFWTTFWGGPTPSDFSPIILAAFAILTGLAAIGTMLYVSSLKQNEARFALTFLFAWLVTLLVALVQFIRTTQGGDQGRYLFPAISVFALFFVLGLNQITHHSSPLLNLSLAVGAFVMGVAVPFAYTLPAYARPHLLDAKDLARFSETDRTKFANRIELLGSELGAYSRKPGEMLQVTLYWRALAPMPESYRVFVHLVGHNDASAGGVDVIPARGAFPTLYWKPGDALRDSYYLPIVLDALPGKYSVEVGLYPVGKPNERLTANTGDDRVILGSIKITAPTPLTYAPAVRLNALFDDQIELLGYDASAAQTLARLILYWRARTAPNRDYKIFVHALDGEGKIIAQADQEPQDGNYPTSIWAPGEQVRDEYALAVPTNRIRIELGVYRADTGERLPVLYNNRLSDHIEFTLGATP